MPTNRDCSVGPSCSTDRIRLVSSSSPAAIWLAYLYTMHCMTVAGMTVVDQIYSRYRERPQQSRITAEGNAYLASDFPLLSYVRSTLAVGPVPPSDLDALRGDDSWTSSVWVIAAAIVGAFGLCLPPACVTVTSVSILPLGVTLTDPRFSLCMPQHYTQR